MSKAIMNDKKIHTQLLNQLKRNHATFAQARLDFSIHDTKISNGVYLNIIGIYNYINQSLRNIKICIILRPYDREVLKDYPPPPKH